MDVIADFRLLVPGLNPSVCTEWGERGRLATGGVSAERRSKAAGCY